MAVKTVNGIAVASMKTWNGIAAASVKTIDGVAVSAGVYTAYATTFVAANPDWMERDAGLTGAVDSTEMIFSCWVDLDTLTGASEYLIAGITSLRYYVFISSAGVVTTRFRNSDNANRVVVTQNTGLVPALTAAGGRYHILISFNNAMSGGFTYMFINDVDCSSVTTSYDGATIDWTDSDFVLGANSAAGALPYNGSIGELYFNIADSLDLSVESNRRKFISAGGGPVDLGADGSTPTGTAPILYLRSDYTAFGTDSSGNGNNLTNKGGTLGDGGTF